MGGSVYRVKEGVFNNHPFTFTENPVFKETEAMPTIHNPNCDGGHCTDEVGEVRRLPLTGNSAIFVCRDCYTEEISHRKDRNRDLSPESQFDLPTWESLEVYTGQ